MTTHKKRVKSVVDNRVQWTLALRVVIHFFVFLCGSAIFGMMFQYLSDPAATPAEQLQAFWHHTAPLLIVLLCLMPMFIRDTLRQTNRVAGPICRLRDTMRRIRDGEEVPPLKFRKNDMWDDIPELFNAMVAELKASEPNAFADDIQDANAERTEEVVSTY